MRCQSISHSMIIVPARNVLAHHPIRQKIQVLRASQSTELKPVHLGSLKPTFLERWGRVILPSIVLASAGFTCCLVPWQFGVLCVLAGVAISCVFVWSNNEKSFKSKAILNTMRAMALRYMDRFERDPKLKDTIERTHELIDMGPMLHDFIDNCMPGYSKRVFDAHQEVLGRFESELNSLRRKP